MDVVATVAIEVRIIEVVFREGIGVLSLEPLKGFKPYENVF